MSFGLLPVAPHGPQGSDVLGEEPEALPDPIGEALKVHLGHPHMVKIEGDRARVNVPRRCSALAPARSQVALTFPPLLTVGAPGRFTPPATACPASAIRAVWPLHDEHGKDSDSGHEVDRRARSLHCLMNTSSPGPGRVTVYARLGQLRAGGADEEEDNTVERQVRACHIKRVRLSGAHNSRGPEDHRSHPALTRGAGHVGGGGVGAPGPPVRP